MKEKWQRYLENNGKKRILICGILLILLIILIGAGIFMSQSKEKKETNYLDYVTGLRNWKVEVNTEEVDYLLGVEWNEDYISEVTVNDKDVDLSKEGKYDLIYTIDVKEKGVNDLKQKKTVQVISKEEAEEAAEEGEEVATEEGVENQKEPEKPKETSKKATSTDNKKENNTAGSSNSSSSGLNKPSGNESTSKPSGGNSSSGNQESSKPSHTHNWQPQYSTVHHDAVYQQQWVVDVPETTTAHEICNQCGADITGNASAHNKQHALAGESGGWHTEWITTPEQGHYENVLVSEAWDEQVLEGYKCSCGATK